MRRLGASLGVSGKTIYNYYTSKDELYLYLLISGFSDLYAELLDACDPVEEPFNQLRAMSLAYVRFGLEHQNVYDIMFTFYIPRAKDFLGTPLELLARKELTNALKVRDLFVKTLSQVVDDFGTYKKEDTQTLFVDVLTGLHGLVALYNNTILDYLHESPLTGISVCRDACS